MKTLLFILIIPFILFANSDRALYIKKYKNEAKTALIIGNGNYSNFSKLKNSKNDAYDMQKILKKQGFDVLYLKDGNLRNMKKIVRKFTSKLKKGGVGLFYYAGHGIEVDGKNYLIPTNAQIPAKDEVEFEAIPMDFIVNKMEASNNRLNIVVLDACRNDPFSRSGGGGLAQINNAKGMYIAFATAPGEVASDGKERNGLFTKHLIDNIKEPNLTLNQVFKRTREGVYKESGDRQLPWTSSSVIGNFYFQITDTSNKLAQPSPKVQKTPKSINSNVPLEEKEFWDVVLEEDSLEYYKMYLSEYPNGYYKSIARSKLNKDKNKKAKEVWESIKNSKYPIDFIKFKNKYPNSKYASFAKIKSKKNKFNKDVIIFDRFNNDLYSWANSNHDKASIKIKDGKYEFSHKRDGKSWNVWKTFYDLKEDYIIEMDTEFKSGTQNRGYGILMAASSTKNMYWFSLSQTGFYSFGKFKDNKWIDIIKWKKSKHLKSYGVNRIKIKKSGKTLSFYINDKYVDSDYNFSEVFGKKIGMFVEYKQKILFDNIKITNLGSKKYIPKTVVFDNFRNNSKKWIEKDNTKIKLDVVAGKYIVEHKSDSGTDVALNYFGKAPKNYNLSISSKHIKGDDNAPYGLVFGDKLKTNQYWFSIAQTGYFRLGRFKDKTWEVLIPWEKISFINKNKSNKLKIKKDGNKLKLYVNNKLTKTYTMDGKYLNKYFGVHISGKQKIEFDDFLISKP